MLLSIIIPVYNEEKRLFHLDDVFLFLKKQDFNSEVILVNDGSTDSTKTILSKDTRIKLISYSKNQGKGHAIKQGMQQAKGDYHLFCDIDMSTPIAEFTKFRKFIQLNDIVIGSRKTTGSLLLKRQHPLRENLGKVFTNFSRIFLSVPVTDFTCGFKCFSKESSQKIFSKTRVKRWGFDSEILFLAKKYGYTIKEVAVEWKNDSQSKVKFPQDILTSAYDLLQVRINDLSSRY